MEYNSESSYSLIQNLLRWYQDDEYSNALVSNSIPRGRIKRRRTSYDSYSPSSPRLPMIPIGPLPPGPQPGPSPPSGPSPPPPGGFGGGDGPKAGGGILPPFWIPQWNPLDPFSDHTLDLPFGFSLPNPPGYGEGWDAGGGRTLETLQEMFWNIGDIGRNVIYNNDPNGGLSNDPKDYNPLNETSVLKGWNLWNSFQDWYNGKDAQEPEEPLTWGYQPPIIGPPRPGGGKSVGNPTNTQNRGWTQEGYRGIPVPSTIPQNLSGSSLKNTRGTRQGGGTSTFGGYGDTLNVSRQGFGGGFGGTFENTTGIFQNSSQYDTNLTSLQSVDTQSSSNNTADSGGDSGSNV